jgi:uncharacterized protein YqjF (DUF2071 family)
MNHLPDGRPRAGGPWLWAQQWRELLFAHWRVAASALRPHVPARLELDALDDAAWVSAVAFRLSVRRRNLPPCPAVRDFAELNLRTYVRFRGEPGIVFPGIHAGGRWAVRLARWATPLPYRFAPMRTLAEGPRRRFVCADPAGGKPLFDADFTPSPPASAAAPGSPAEWLLERYALFAPGAGGRLLRTVADHAPWVAEPVEGTVAAAPLGEPFGLDLSAPPAATHYCQSNDARVWPFEPAE